MSSENELSQRISRLTPDKRALLERRLRGEKISKPNDQISRVDRYGELPASYAQERLWFFDQLEPQSSTYNIPLAIRIRGKLDKAILRRCLDDISHRHEILRTTFKVGKQGQPVQIISSPEPIELSIIDISSLSVDLSESEAIERAEVIARKPFDLTSGPLWRVNLFKTSEDEYLLGLVMHHIISDGWSKEIFLQELTALYDAYSNASSSPLTELAIQYVDYAAWQRERLEGDRLEELLDYWKAQLRGDLPVLELPTDYPRPATQTFNGANHYFVLSEDLLKPLKSFCQSEGVTLFMTLLAVFDILLWRYTGQTDLLVGTPISNRERRELESLIGFFVNTLVIRSDVSGNPTFREVVSRVREVALRAFEHRELPFEKLVDSLKVERNLSYSPIFQVMFALQNAPMAAIQMRGLRLERVEIETGASMFDLTLVVTDMEHGLECFFEYNRDLFAAKTVQRMARHYQILLRSVLENPDQRISGLQMLSEAEIAQVLTEWCGDQAQMSQGQTLIQLFEHQVIQTPENIALIFKDQRISYRELNQRANKLAHYLNLKYVRQEVPVAVCMNYSVEMIVALIGVIKAGGVYVPLDPEHPRARLGYMLEDTDIQLVLTQQPLDEKFLGFPVETLCLNKIEEELENRYYENPNIEVEPENLAYIIYTSGSSGRPKGVMISHGAIAAHCEMIGSKYDLRPADRVLQFTKPIFDASLEQIFAAFSVGAGVALREQEIWEASEFENKIIQMGITVVDLPPAYWRQVAEEWERLTRNTTSMQLRLVIVGGDIMPTESLQIWRESPFCDIRLMNAYGPTETTVTATIFEVTDHFAERSTFGMIPVGRPVGGKKVYVLDASGNPVPVGVPGELYIGGFGLGRGYLNRPEFTAERFVPDPFTNNPGSCMYKTGDRVQFLSDGNLVYLGRLDEQVKVRGYRIELGEIETRLGQYSGVRETVVIAKHGPSGEQQIVAYIVPETGMALDASDLYAYLSKYLPAYMLPAAFVQLDEIPRTFSNKVDRQSLPDPDLTQTRLRKEYKAPESPTEKSIALIWSELMGLEDIGLNDNFFELGGHSLLAARMISRLREEFNVYLPLRVLFEAPTVAGLAEQIDAILWAKQGAASPGAIEGREEISL